MSPFSALTAPLALLVALLGELRPARGAPIVGRPGGSRALARRQVVRSEGAGTRSMLVGSDGLIADETDADDASQPSAASPKAAPGLASAAIAHRRDWPYCNRNDYKLGVENSSACSGTAPGHEQPIMDVKECIRAAGETGATWPSTWQVEERFFDVRPKGCFVFPCSEDPNGKCFFFNAIPDNPQHPVGTPICSRPRYVNGTANTAGACPEGYQAIVDPAICEVMGHCLDHCLGKQFEVDLLNRSMFHNFPQGCFIHNTDKCFYYNAPSASMGTPAHPTGVPLCNVSSRLMFSLPTNATSR